MKKIILIVGILLLVAAIIIVAQNMLFNDESVGNMDVENMEYKVERDPIENRFPDIPDFIECYWKADTVGPTNFGPTNYWMKGFLCLDENAFHNILADYEWNSVGISFPKGINPDITGKSDFDWHNNKDFQSMVLKQNFVGSIYLDTVNGVLYFDVENS